jgi:hypothetical protein
MKKVLYEKISIMFESLLKNAINERSHESDKYNIDVVKASRNYNILRFYFNEFDEIFTIMYDKKINLSIFIHLKMTIILCQFGLILGLILNL